MLLTFEKEGGKEGREKKMVVGRETGEEPSSFNVISREFTSTSIFFGKFSSLLRHEMLIYTGESLPTLYSVENPS